MVDLWPKSVCYIWGSSSELLQWLYHNNSIKNTVDINITEACTNYKLQKNMHLIMRISKCVTGGWVSEKKPDQIEVLRHGVQTIGKSQPRLYRIKPSSQTKSSYSTLEVPAVAPPDAVACVPALLSGGRAVAPDVVAVLSGTSESLSCWRYTTYTSHHCSRLCNNSTILSDVITSICP